MTRSKLNGRDFDVDADPDTPFLWAIRDDAKLKGTKFGCGIGMCGARRQHEICLPVRRKGRLG